MKFASEDLKNEHEGILFGLKILEKMVFLMEDRQGYEREDLKQIVDFLKLFADKCHHGKEEGLYFPALESAGVSREGGPIGQMLAEHAEGREFVRLMGKSVDAKFFDQKTFADAASNYISLLRSHISKENNILFPMGDTKIAAERQTSLLEEFEDFEEKVMGKGTHERLHGLLNAFEAKYLSKG